MQDTALTITGLKKVYKLYEKPVDRLREILFRKQYHNEFVALDSINIRVMKGETLGIIGENGAGKSTLLKIIARTLKATEGEVDINGRVSSLLELGSGFHPEFTGIDNIYFYGSLLGIPPAQMKERIKEIVSFAEIGEHINYPLKTYSSGMYVRLAFSVAMAVEPDILVVDEALSVGDLYFQKKSTDKILSIKEKGKTIFFCSHEMYHVARLCDRVLWLKNGRIQMEGQPFEVIREYETYQMAKSSKAPEPQIDNPAVIANENFQQLSEVPHDKSEKPLVFIKDVWTLPSGDVETGKDLYVKTHIVTSDSAIPYRIAVLIKNVDGLFITGIGTTNMPPFYGKKTVTLLFPNIQLRAGNFIVEAFAFDEEGVYWYDRKEAPPIKISRDSLDVGIIRLPHQWIVD